MAKYKIKDSERFKYTAKELSKKINEYFHSCEDACKCPTFPGLANYLDVRTKVLEYWLKGEMGEKGEDIQILVEKASARIADELQQRKDSMAIFLLKQPVYGGYSDKSESDKEININLSFGGMDKSEVENWGK